MLEWRRVEFAALERFRAQDAAYADLIEEAWAQDLIRIVLENPARPRSVTWKFFAATLLNLLRDKPPRAEPYWWTLVEAPEYMDLAAA